MHHTLLNEPSYSLCLVAGWSPSRELTTALCYSEIWDTSQLCPTSFPTLLTLENRSSLLLTALYPRTGLGKILPCVLKRSFPKPKKFCTPELLGCPCCPSPEGSQQQIRIWSCGLVEVWHLSVIHGHLNAWVMTEHLSPSSSSSRIFVQLPNIAAAFLPSMAK